jgi:hypothetical protein
MLRRMKHQSWRRDQRNRILGMFCSYLHLTDIVVIQLLRKPFLASFNVLGKSRVLGGSKQFSLERERRFILVT